MSMCGIGSCEIATEEIAGCCDIVLVIRGFDMAVAPTLTAITNSLKGVCMDVPPEHRLMEPPAEDRTMEVPGGSRC